MLRKLTAPKTDHAHCQHCGTRIDEQEQAENIAEYGDGVEMATAFCSNACARDYVIQHREDVEEFEEIHRAGAT